MKQGQESWTEEEKQAWKIVKKQWLIVGLGAIILFNVVCGIFTRSLEAFGGAAISSIWPLWGILFVFVFLRERYFKNKDYREKTVNSYIRREPKARRQEMVVIWIAFGFLSAAMAVLVIITSRLH